MTLSTRFAPSPTGPLHLGHAYAAWVAADLASRERGRFQLRIEDIDQTRARAEWEAQIYLDLSWLGLEWETPVMRQSDRLSEYQRALDRLWRDGLLYPCNCNRRDILNAATAPQEGAAQSFGPDGLIYPGTCRDKPRPKTRPPDLALRLDMAQALGQAQYCFTETGRGPDGQTGDITLARDHILRNTGDVVLARRDMGTSYHLSVVVDDAAQGITTVTRGHDLFDATQIHIVLQSLLGFDVPRYHHHRLIRDDAGKRLAKRDDARAIRTYRDDGYSVSDIKTMIGLG
ncbi:Glutamate--tRNA ligase [Roseobacter fucihabitans]|uniref:Glutamate--tRNA ligase n=1 Tax=Roseobacter fucihabitans TaxID=1537242 RepID=A0ABZ2BT73_9RHOB|nr:tRNA glutamyl-Q(34) synthetase GluQRS [Roseobacter litoralis]MBC6965735.1 Glutamate--tRNA ligase [Roseobacter litoralis]